MKITIDASPTLGQQTGVGRYTNELINNLNIIDKQNNYSLYFNYFRPGKINPFKEYINSKSNRIPAKIQRILHNRFKLPIELFTGKTDLFHGPNYFIPPSISAKKIVTIHDLAFLLYPETLHANDASYYQKYVPKSINSADHVIVVSNSTKQDLIKYLDVEEEKISITLEAASEEFKPIKNDSLLKSTLKKYNLNETFMLTVCTLEPRKNLITLIEALGILKNKNLLKQKLVVVGGSGWKNEKLFSKIEKLGLKNDIIFPGYIESRDLPVFYNACSIFLFPTLYEGFGIPALEALACGCPSICSNSSSIPEVVGNASILIDPLDAQKWADTINELLNNPELQKKLREKAITQTSKFSWKKMAQETLEVYKKVING